MKHYTILFFLLFNFNLIELKSQDKIPNLYVKTIDGKPIRTISTINSEGLTIYSFWATWCIPCIVELNAIHEVYDQWTEETNVKLIAVALDDNRTKRRVRPFVSGKGWEFEILLDENQDFQRALNIENPPYTIVTDGIKILQKRNGYKPGEENDLFEFILKNSKQND